MYKNVHDITTCHSKTQNNSNACQQSDGQTVVSLQNGILYSNRNKRTSAKHNKIDESLKKLKRTYSMILFYKAKTEFLGTHVYMIKTYKKEIKQIINTSYLRTG